MTKFIRSVFLLALFLFAIGPPVFAQMPKIMKLEEIQPGTKAVGFSVFKGTEPEPFDVELRGVTDAGGFRLILIRISGGPMETPLENIGAIAGMSGSPIFVGCSTLEECEQNGTLVGALSYALGYFIEGGSNAAATPAEYMLGAQLGDYNVASQFSVRPPNKIIVDGFEFKNLLLFSDLDLSSLRGSSSSVLCPESVRSDIRPGSMVTVFLARGTINIGGSGTVVWRNKNGIFIFGHPFFGTGQISYPFAHVAVADTLQTPLNAHKIVGCQLQTEGAMLVDGLYEMAGVIDRSADTLPYRVELHMGQGLAVMEEQIAESPLARPILNQLPVMRAQGLIGDTTYLSVSHQTRIEIQEEQDIFIKNLISAKAVEGPLSKVFANLDATLNELGESRFNHKIENVVVHVDIVRGEQAWKVNRSSLSQTSAAPSETVHINVVLEEYSSGSLRQVSIPVKMPEDFLERVRPGMPPMPPAITVKVQSSDKFVDQREPKKAGSLADLIGQLNEDGNRSPNVLYVQQIMPRPKAERDADKENTKAAIQSDWEWTEVSQDDLDRLPPADNREVILNTTPGLDHYISFDATFVINVVNSNDAGGSADMADGQDKKKRWFDRLKPWGWF